MIKTFLICDSNGIPFYSKILDNQLTEYDPNLFSGFISAISTIGKNIFQEEIATITFGEKGSKAISVISRDFFGLEKKVFFVFFHTDTLDHSKVKKLVSNILMEIRDFLKDDSSGNLTPGMKQKIHKIIESTL